MGYYPDPWSGVRNWDSPQSRSDTNRMFPPILPEMLQGQKGIDEARQAGYFSQQLTPYDPLNPIRPEGFRETWGYVNDAGDLWNPNTQGLNSTFSGKIEALDTNPNLEPLNDLYPAPPQQWKDQPRSLDNAMTSWTNGPGASQLNQAEDAQALKNAQFGSDLGSFQPTTGDTQVLDYVDKMASNPAPTQTQVQDAYKNTGLKENGPYGNQPYYSPLTPIPQEGGLFSQRERESGQWQQYGNVIAPPPPTETSTPTPTQALPASNPTQTTPASNFTPYNAAPSNRAPMWNESSIWSPQAAQAGPATVPKPQPLTPQEAGSWYPGYEVPGPSRPSEWSRRSASFRWGAPSGSSNSWSPTPIQNTNQNSWGTTQTNMWGL